MELNMEVVIEGAHRFSEMEVWKAYLIAAVMWSLCLIPAHIVSSLVSTTYQKQLMGQSRLEWLSRCVSNVHAVLVSIILTYAVFWEKSAYNGGEYELRWLCRTGLLMAVGYFMYDACLVLYSIRTAAAGPSTLCHHILVGPIIHYTLTVECPLVIIWSAGAYLTEYSTPFVNARWFLLFRHKDTTLYNIVGTFMTIAFFFARILYMPYLLFFIFSSSGLISTIPSKDIAFRYGIIGMFGHMSLYALNLYWFSLIMRGLIKMLRSLGKGENTEVVGGGAVEKPEKPMEAKKAE